MEIDEVTYKLANLERDVAVLNNIVNAQDREIKQLKILVKTLENKSWELGKQSEVP